MPGLALYALLSWPGVGLVAALWLLSALRLRVLGFDRPRPAWLVRFVDEPVFWHWGAGLIALLAYPVVAGALAIWSFVAGSASAWWDGWGSAAVVSYGAGLLLAAHALWGQRLRVRVCRVEVPIPRLPPELDGYRIVQLSDLHIGSFDGPRRAQRWVQAANAERPNLIAVTGDLVTSGTTFYDTAAEVLGGLRADDGVWLVFGNHDQWDNRRFARALSSRGVRLLQNAFERVAAGRLVVAGVDDAYTGKSDLDRTLDGRSAREPTVLLSHYPDFFEPAAERGVDLVLSGHTHGGQFAVPFLAERFSLARLLGRRGRGLFRQGASFLYVSAGLGTTGPPLRIGVPPEIAVLVLRAPAGSID